MLFGIFKQMIMGCMESSKRVLQKLLMSTCKLFACLHDELKDGVSPVKQAKFSQAKSDEQIYCSTLHAHEMRSD